MGGNTRVRILVTTYQIGRVDHLDQSEAYDISQLVREYEPWEVGGMIINAAIFYVGSCAISIYFLFCYISAEGITPDFVSHIVIISHPLACFDGAHSGCSIGTTSKE